MIKQFGAIPFRRERGATRILLITSRETKRWVIPRGNPIPGLSAPKTAEQEAIEEAGIRGIVSREPVGRYAYGKRRRDGSIVVAVVEVYGISVETELDDWPERHERERRWFEPEAAAAAVNEADLAELIRKVAKGGS
jgi:uncharacterized protein